mmetsp:Transcript_5636/g.13281  ORF Transcript_5636/g.13281 Transcript_5636/m.13281 type:complete len:592 (+) Transcript_5636:128-1903(+)
MDDIGETIRNICGLPGDDKVVIDNIMADTNNDKTILDYFQENVKLVADQTFLTQPMGNNIVMEWTYEEVLTAAKKVAAYIQSLELPERSQIAILSKNCAWWVVTDIGIWLSGHVSVPIYPGLTAETTKYTLEHSESKLLFVGKLDEKPWEEQKNGIPEDLPTVSFPLSPPNGAKKTWQETVGEMAPSEKLFKPELDSMATIIYTSGSTGKPKGVMTSFRAITAATRGLVKSSKITSADRYLSYLPLSHGMERWTGQCVPMYCGMQVFYAESITTFVDDLNRGRPTLFVSVPRLWTKFQAGVFKKMPQGTLDTLLKIPLVNNLIRHKILSGLGLDCVRQAASGSAPIPAELLEWYRALGLELLEGYGMTENFNYSHVSIEGQSRAGYVGNTYDDVQCRIAQDGEIQVLTPGKMMGYFKNADATKETITEDGWVRTGDKGEIDEEGRLKITGRTKEIFKTSKGKYVAPSPIENKFVSHAMVEMACVCGRGQPQPHVILQLAEDVKKKAKNDGHYRQEVTTALISHLTNVVNPSLDAHEQLDFVVIVSEDWLPENGFLTPTQKIKRSVIDEAYTESIPDWYKEAKKVIFHGDWM